MASRSCGQNSNRDWDPMQEDFSNSNYDSQYPDDSSNDQVKLDHCRLYMTNIPKGLSDDGLRSAFEKFGTLHEVFVSKHPTKMYGMVAFETPAEARHAMMKLNKTEPLRLNISIAHEKKEKKDNYNAGRSASNTGRSTSTREQNAGASRERATREREDNTGYGTRWKSNSNRKLDEMANGDNIVSNENSQVDLEDDLSLVTIDPDLQLELEKLHLERLKIQQAEVVCKQRMLLKQVERRALAQTQPNSRCVLPDGKIVLRNISGSRSAEHGDSRFAAGAGDSLSQLKIPALQRAGSRACLVCGAPADSFCARCGITPYCSTHCQRRDWADRHADVCHNLARMNAVLDVDNHVEVELNVPQPAPLRQPRSPPTREPVKNDNGNGSDRGSKKFPPSHHSVTKSFQRNGGNGGGGGKNGNNRQNDQSDKPARQLDRADRQPDRSHKQGLDGGRPPRKAPASNDGNGNKGQGNRNGHQHQHSGHSYRDNRQSQNRASFAEHSQNDEDWDEKDLHNSQPQLQVHHCGASRSITFRDGRRFQSRWTEQGSDCVQNWQAAKANSPTKKATPLAHAAKEAVPEPDLPRAKQVEPTPAPTIQRSPPANQQEPLAKQQEPPAKQQEPPAKQTEEQAPATNAKPPGSASDVTPTRKLVPKHCILDLLSKGDSLIVSVENTEEACHSSGKGFVCLMLSQMYAEDYAALCGPYSDVCEADKTPYTPSPGDTFSVLNERDSAWYRARCLSKSVCALLDSNKVLPLEGARCVRLPAAYERAPEFSAVLQADVQLGTSLKCVMNEKTANGWTVELYSTEGDQLLGRGEASRWLPAVQYPPATVTTAIPEVPRPAIPEVPRPAVTNGSSVYIVHVTDCSNVYVRGGDAASQQAFDTVLQDVALYGVNAEPLTTPPAMGSYVISKYTDEIHYRALVKRTNVKQNKYLLEYVEYGNFHVNQLENLFPCPKNFLPSAAKPMTSRVVLRGVTSEHPLTPPAEAYLDTLKDDSVELVLTIPDASASAPAGSEVTLTVAANKENVNKKVEEMCTPEWLQIQRRGGNVLEVKTTMYTDLQYLDLPSGSSELIVLDVSILQGGSLCVCPSDRPHLFKELEALTERMAKYCESELGREPYLPKVEEVCIVKMPSSQKWYRAVFAEQVSGPGGTEAEVCYIDYGNMERVPVQLLRKMLPEFVSALPAISNQIEIKDFPPEPSNDMMQRAMQHLSMDDQGRGRVFVTECTKTDAGLYTAYAPKLLAAMAGL